MAYKDLITGYSVYTVYIIDELHQWWKLQTFTLGFESTELRNIHGIAATVM